jgi:hypothetical protein
MWSIALSVALQVRAPVQLPAASGGAARPSECMPSSRTGPSVWARARQPQLGPYCDLLARAYLELSQSPERSKATAQKAMAMAPQRAAPHVVLGRAEAELGKWKEALAEFEAARKLEPRSLEEPGAMHALARAQVKAGQLAAALDVYRVLVPRADLLGGDATRVRVLVSAALVAMAVEAAQPEARAKGAAGAPRRLNEAVAFLREAKTRGASLAGEVGVALALALDRSGESALAATELDAAARAGAKPGGLLASLSADAAETSALEAMATEAATPQQAAKAWEGYLAGPGGKTAFAPAAKARLEALKKGGGRAQPRP